MGTERNGADPGSEQEHFFFPDGLEKGEKKVSLLSIKGPLLQWEVIFY